MSASTSNELDISNASRGVWLVKVPKYMAKEWEKAPPMSEIGRLKITKGPGGKAEILFDLSNEIVRAATKSKEKDQDSSPSIPKEHRFAISEISHQHLALFSHLKDDKNSQLTLEGNVVQKGECRPIGDSNYMKLKTKTIKEASQPTRLVKQLDKAVVNYKPVAAHRVEVEFEQKRKSEGKKSRDDKDKVMEILFEAFEKHQYYNIKALEQITKQPVPYLKEILKEICNYNAKNPHKNMWELKPEYRHYNSNERGKPN